MFAAAWLVMAIGMGLGLYDAAFATLGRLYGTDARGAITGITLLAGFASTIGWPLTAWGASTIGWRETCLAWAAVHLFIALPMNYCAAAAAHRDGGRCSRRCDRQADTDRPADDPAGLRLCRGLDRHRRHGRALPAHPRGHRRVARAGDRRRRADRPGAGGGAPARGRSAGALPSAGLGAPGDAHPSDRRRGHPAGRRRGRVQRLRRPARLGQRHHHHRARDGAAGDVRAGELRLSPGPHRRARALPAGRRAARLLAADRAHRHGRPAGVVGAQPFRLPRALPAARAAPAPAHAD